MDKLSDSESDKILLRVFSYLSKRVLCHGVRKTCSRWWRLSKDPTLWRKFTITKFFTEDRMSLLMKQVGQHLYKLDMRDYQCNIYRIIPIFTEISLSFPNLTTLLLPSAQVFDQSPETNVETLCKILSVLFPNLEFIQSVNLKCQSYFPNLRVVFDYDVSETWETWFQHLTALSSKCKSVTQYFCKATIRHFNRDILQLISREFQDLKTLLWDIDDRMLSDSVLKKNYPQQTVDNLNNIVIYLYIIDCPEISDRGLEMIVSHSEQIKTICIERAPAITKEGVKLLLSKCVNVVDVMFKLEAVSNCCFKEFLERNDVADVPYQQVDDDCVEHMAKSCNSLKYFCLHNCFTIADSEIHYLWLYAKQLHCLQLKNCPKITDYALEIIATIQQLEILMLDNCSVTPHGIVHLITTTSSLKTLELFWCCHLQPDNDLADLAAEVDRNINSPRCPYTSNPITTLSISCDNNEFVYILASLMPNLTVINILAKWEANTTENCIDRILSCCLQLEQLKLQSVEVNPRVFEVIALKGLRLRKLFLRQYVIYMSCYPEDYLPVIQHCPCLDTIEIERTDEEISASVLLEYIKEHHDGQCSFIIDDNVPFISFTFLPLIYRVSGVEP